MKDYKGKIKSVKKISIDAYELLIQSDLENAISGQFISILCPNTTLRRPFSIAGFDKETKTLKILIKLKGDGTNYLKTLKENDEINFLAPLGNGFKIENKKSLLIGAGIGIAPMLFLKDELKNKNIENYLISGFKAQEEMIEGSDKTVIGGSVLDNLDEIIKEKNIEILYSCGPHIVLKLVSQLAKKHNIEAQVAMEKTMACSIGVCRGCIIKINKQGKIENASVCKDGPVFYGDEVIWE
ncbi:MAG: hypothetical protein IJD57_07980 [Candidatus Gastranaerophilales bacterium]|nr:hypothetical protein [Candidatus Gastranaerophilales bacterium]